MKLSRNAPCPCGSGKKYKKCCLSQDTAAGVRERKPHHELLSDLIESERYMDELERLTNETNDHIRAGEWAQAEQGCRELLERFPDEVDGHHRFHEYHMQRRQWTQARKHAAELLAMVEQRDGFEPDYPDELRADIADLDERIAAAGNPPD